jgi:hypothetical protein
LTSPSSVTQPLETVALMRSAGMPLRHLSESTVRWEAKYRRVQEVLLPRCPLERVVITTTMQRRATPRHRRCSAREPAEVHMIRKLKSGQYRLHSRKADLRTGEYVLRRYGSAIRDLQAARQAGRRRAAKKVSASTSAQLWRLWRPLHPSSTPSRCARFE